MTSPVFLLAAVALILTLISGVTGKLPDWIGLLILCIAVMFMGYSH